MTPEQIEFYRKAADDGSIPDAENPLFVFNITGSLMLTMLAYGDIDPVEIAKMELANRGLDKEGKWVGFEEAEKLHFPAKMKKSKIKNRYGRRL